MKKKKKLFAISADALKMSINFFVGYSREETNKWLVEHKYEAVDFIDGQALADCFVQESETFFFYGIVLPKFELNRADICILVHELSHIVGFQLKEKGIDDTETRAYLTEYYLDEFLKKYNFK